MAIHGKIDIRAWSFDEDFKVWDVASAISDAAKEIVEKKLNPQRILKTIGEVMTRELRATTVHFDFLGDVSHEFPLVISLPLGESTDYPVVLAFDMLDLFEADITGFDGILDEKCSPGPRDHYVAMLRRLADRLEGKTAKEKK